MQFRFLCQRCRNFMEMQRSLKALTRQACVDMCNGMAVKSQRLHLRIYMPILWPKLGYVRWRTTGRWDSDNAQTSMAESNWLTDGWSDSSIKRLNSPLLDQWVSELQVVAWIGRLLEVTSTFSRKFERWLQPIFII